VQIGEDGVVSLGLSWPAMEEREKRGINGEGCGVLDILEK